jgi:lipopolysaccharide transport system ATP-binding protein
VADIYGRVGSLLEVGTGFHPELSGTDNIYMSGAILGMGRNEIRRKFDEIVEFAEIERFLETPVKRYSSGMYVRLAFAVAAHLEPEILFVDEVLAVGDVQFQRKCLGKMREVGSGGRTIVFVSHNLNAVAALCRSAIVLSNGTIVHHSDDVQKALYVYADNETPSAIGDLTDHRGRVPHGPPVYRNIEIHSDENGESHLVPPGANVLIRFKVMTAEKVIGPKLSIGVTSDRGERIFAVGTHIGGSAISHIQGLTRVDVRFKLPYLVPGQYKLDIGFCDRNNRTMDEIYGAAVIEVLKDNYLTMIDPHGAHTGQVMVRSEWEAVRERSH